MNQKTMPAYLFVIALFLVLGFASMVAIAKNDNANSNSAKSEKSEKTEKGDKTAQSDKAVGENNLKNYKKPDKNKGETNAKVYKEKNTEVVKSLEQVKTQTQNQGEEDALKVEVKNKAKKQIEEVATEQAASQEEVTKAIEEVEDDSAAKKFFLGPDYKNLGQLRSELVHNRNQIRKLTQAINTLSQNGGDTANLELQLQTLTQERERIKNIITTNQEGFSLFGWVNRFLNNYEKTPINEEEENDLTKEVEEALDDSEENNQDETTEAEITQNSGEAVTDTTENVTSDTGEESVPELVQ